MRRTLPLSIWLRIATPVCGLVRNDVLRLAVLNDLLIYKKPKTRWSWALELLARFELATRFPRNRGFVEALRPRIQILSAYADRADEAASFPDGRLKNDQGQTALVIFWSC